MSIVLPDDFDPSPSHVQHHAWTFVEDTCGRVTAASRTIPKEVAASHDVENASHSMLAPIGSNPSTDFYQSLQVATSSIPPTTTTA